MSHNRQFSCCRRPVSVTHSNGRTDYKLRKSKHHVRLCAFVMTTVWKLKWKKALRETQTPRALAVVRFGHRPPARPLQTRPQTGPITIHCAAKLSAQCNYVSEQTCRKFLLTAAQWLKWSCEAGGGAHLTKRGWSKPRTHSNPTNLALFRHKITLYRLNQGGSNGSRGLSLHLPPHFNHCFCALIKFK